MNSKESFLNALQQGIAVLAEAEQQDILEEYAQHIEIKMSGGLTEEEAVQDFGDVQQLIAEILEAYHVDPLYAAGNRKSQNMSDSIRRQITCLAGLIQSGANKIARFAMRFFRAVQTGSERTLEESPNDTRNAICDPCKKMGSGFAGLLKATARFVWNGVLLLCAIPVLFMGIAVLLLLGVIVVWLFQGMPLLGALLSCLGILSTCVGVIGLGNNLVWHRRKADDSRKAHQEVAVAGETLTKKEGIDDVEE